MILPLLLLGFMKAHAELAWYDQVRELSDETKTTEILAHLRQDPKLPNEVCQALKSGNREAEALDITTRLEIRECWPEVFSVVKTGSAWMAVIAAQSLNKKHPREEWKSWLRSSLSRETWNRLTPEFKLAILPVVAELQLSLPLSSIRTVLADPDSDVRESALMLLEQAMENDGKNKQLQKLLRHSLTSKPYQFRMTAFMMLNHLPSEIKNLYKSDIDHCVKAESQPRVKETCIKLQKSS